MQEKPTPDSHALSVYYPFALADLVDILQADDYEETGEVLLVFTDEEGCRVTVRVRPEALEALADRLKSPANKGET